MRASLTWIVAVVLVSACGGDDGGDQPIDAASIDAPDLPIDAMQPDGPWVEPTMLSQTGLYSDITTQTIAPGVIEYAPRWHLWSDSATKRRWIWLPPGAKIDTTADMDFWSFPPGTKFWKEFSRDGMKVETRFLEKIGTADDVASWYMVSFQWPAGGTGDPMAVPGGVVDDTGVNDIPARSACRQCHGPNRNKSIILGFQALQLDYDATGNGMDLGRLVAEDRLTTAPPAPGAGAPYFPLPASGSGVDVVEPAIGYLHANCGGCHNEFSDVVTNNGVTAQFRLTTASAERTTWAVTRPYTTAVNQATHLNGQGTHVVKGMDTAQSAVFNRMNTTGGAVRMPPVARETIDTTAVSAVESWINSLPPPP